MRDYKKFADGEVAADKDIARISISVRYKNGTNFIYTSFGDIN